MKSIVVCVVGLAVAAGVACGAGQKIEAGANQVDNSLDKSTKKAEKEANSMMDDGDAGKK